ncbi:hypothetical protein HDIA_3445 [Hartmannibacter diazotrophicus]|uniref:Nucleoside-diphosphate sugar epimerase n=1 Tax=Hartmannibacter diazotrophicus TaxID=1482074 RepID=A0A2C9D9N7_9HYPH|nr:mitochondrial fission ELM1 family protein [Hartmannibacter diazotrophicus]SON56986.1 hypothetical protein HDIA_3445 [Hartmannibacter diazotrophicus]
MAETRSSARPVAWVLSSGKRGHDIKGLGVARRLGLEPDLKQVTLGWLGRLIAPRGLARLDGDLKGPPWPDLVFASGRRTIPGAMALKRRLGNAVFVMALDDPGLPPERFDLVWASAHDGLSGPNVITTLTAPHLLTAEGLEREGHALAETVGPARLERRPVVGVLVGGPSGAYRFAAEEAADLGARLAAMQAESNAFVIVCGSRRTPPEALAAIAGGLDEGNASVFDAHAGFSPYQGVLGLSSHLIVTPDSANMIGEAAFTGKPVMVARFAGGSAKFDRFHEGMLAAGAMRWFDGKLETWDYVPLDATGVVASAVLERLPAGIAARMPHRPDLSTSG